MVEGGLRDAAVLLDQALQRDPMSALLHRLRALVSWTEGRPEAALDDLAEAAAIAPNLHSPRIELTSEDAQWVRAEGLRRALERYPRQRVRTLLALAEELRGTGFEEQGRALLQDEPYNPDVELTLAAWDRDADRLEQAAVRLTELAGRRLVPTQFRARAWSELAEVRALAGDDEGAEMAARTALSLAPGSTAPYLALAELAERRGDWQLALDQLRRAWGLAPSDARLLVRVAVAAERAGQLADAQLALERALELEPDAPEHAVRLVDFFIRNGQYLEATMALSRALDRWPTEPRLARQLERLQRDVVR
jgi:Tfp pilus assembly protein PilF